MAAALLYGALSTGAESMVVSTGIPLALLTVIIALAILFASAPELTRSIWRPGSADRSVEPDASTPAGPVTGI